MYSLILFWHCVNCSMLLRSTTLAFRLYFQNKPCKIGIPKMQQPNDGFQDESIESQTALELNVSSSLEGLQTEEQRLILDTVAQIRKCGMDGILSLPQLVVCRDQSVGKSSVLEALTEIPVPRNNERFTRFATEIILRHGQTISIMIKVILDSS